MTAIYRFFLPYVRLKSRPGPLLFLLHPISLDLSISVFSYGIMIEVFMRYMSNLNTLLELNIFNQEWRSPFDRLGESIIKHWKLRPRETVFEDALSYSIYDQSSFSVCNPGILFPYRRSIGLIGVKSQPGKQERVLYSLKNNKLCPKDTGNIITWETNFEIISEKFEVNQLTQFSDEIIYAGVINLNSYGHFILECVPRLWEAAKLAGNDENNADLIYLNFFSQFNQSSSLRSLLDPNSVYRLYIDVLGVSEKLRSIGDGICFRHGLIVNPTASLSRVNTKISRNCKSAWQEVNQAAMCLGSSMPKVKSSKIYLSRKSVTQSFLGRSILNEAEVEEVFVSHGFEIISIESLRINYNEYDAESIKHQYLAEAQVVAGPLGSNLLNFVFCQTGTNVLGIANMYLISEVFNASLSHVVYMADYCGMPLSLFIDYDSFSQAWVVDISKLDHYLKRCL